MAFNLVAQCKAGSLILKTLLDGVDLFHQAALSLGGTVGGSGYFAGVDPGYLLCLLVFGLVVVVYTAYGGFHAVVWTDVMQGLVMVIVVLGAGMGCDVPKNTVTRYTHRYTKVNLA